MALTESGIFSFVTAGSLKLAGRDDLLFYEWVANPVARSFEWLVPPPGRRALYRFFENLESPALLVNTTKLPSGLSVDPIESPLAEIPMGSEGSATETASRVGRLAPDEGSANATQIRATKAALELFIGVLGFQGEADQEATGTEIAGDRVGTKAGTGRPRSGS